MLRLLVWYRYKKQGRSFAQARAGLRLQGAIHDMRQLRKERGQQDTNDDTVVHTIVAVIQAQQVMAEAMATRLQQQCLFLDRLTAIENLLFDLELRLDSLIDLCLSGRKSVDL